MNRKTREAVEYAMDRANQLTRASNDTTSLPAKQILRPQASHLRHLAEIAEKASRDNPNHKANQDVDYGLALRRYVETLDKLVNGEEAEHD